MPGAPVLLADGRLLTVRRDAAADRLRLFLDEDPVSPANLSVRSVAASAADAGQVLVRAAPEPDESRLYPWTSRHKVGPAT